MYECVLAAPELSDCAANTPLWCRAALMNAAAGINNLQAKLLNVYKANDLLAQMPIYEQKQLGFLRLLPALGSYYQGLHFYHPQDKSAQRKALDELRISSEVAIFLKSRYKKFSITLLPSNYDMRGFLWNGLKVQALYTYIHDYSSEIQPLSDERKKLRRANKEGYSFEQSSDIPSFLELSQDMYTRKNHKPFKDINGQKTYLQELDKAGLSKQFNVLRGSKIVSSNILLQAKDQTPAYSILRASVKEEMDRGVSLWHNKMLIEAMSSRCTELDFCGANTPDVARFKAAMGLQLRLFFRIST